MDFPVSAPINPPSLIAQYRAPIGGGLILVFVLIALVGEINHQLPSFTGLLALIAIMILPTRLSPALLWQCGVMMAIGLSLLLWMTLVGANIPWYAPLNSNIPLLILFSAVSFLRVLPIATSDKEHRNIGLKAYIQTFLGTHALSAVINMSAAVVVADYLRTSDKPEHTITTMVMRAVCVAAYWSPFFAAMATVLHYLPELSLFELWIYSIPLSVLGLALTIWEARAISPDHLQRFNGYPISIETLLLPLSLLVSVLIARLIWPDVAMVLLVSIASLIIPCILLLKRQGVRNSVNSVRQHIAHKLGNLRGEFLLFISAGVLGSGGNALFKQYPPLLPFETFTATVACVLLLILIGTALLGAHVLVGISISAPVVLSTDPSITLLGLCYLSAWSIASIVSPFSGLALMFRGHYQLSLKEILSAHWQYGIAMTIASMLMFYRV